MMCSISKRWENRKRMGLPMQLDAAIWFVVIAVIIAAFIAGGLHMVKEARIARARLELDTLRSAILEYEAYTGEKQTDFSNLFSTIAKDSNGDPHDAILKPKDNFNADSCKDPWGVEYKLTITGTGSDEVRKVVSSGSGSDITVTL